MEGFESGVGIGLSIIAFVVGVLLLFLLDLLLARGIGAAAERLGLLRRSGPISLFPDRHDGTLAGSGPEVRENNHMQRTAPGKSERRG